MVLREGISDAVRTGVTTGLPYIEIYSFFVTSWNPVLTSSLNFSNSYFIPLVGFPVAILGIRYLADNYLGDSGN